MSELDWLEFGRSSHLVPMFTASEGRLPGTRFQNSYQLRYSASSGRLTRLRGYPPHKLGANLRSMLTTAVSRRLDPVLITPVPTLQVRLLDLESHQQSPKLDKIMRMRATDGPQVRHHFRGRILDVKDERFFAVLESQEDPGESQYEVEIPLADVAAHQRLYVESGAEFSLLLVVKNGQDFSQQINRQFTFDDETDELPPIDPTVLDRAREAARKQRRIWESSAGEHVASFDDPAEG